MRLVFALLALLLHFSTGQRATAPKIVMMGDSTMSSTTNGWALYFRPRLNIRMIDAAVPGASARSYTRNGNFTRAIDFLDKGDFAVVAFGMNDVGSLRNGDNGRTPCPGSGNEVCNTSFQKGILTYAAYIREAAAEIRRKGAILILCGPIPRNPWATGTFQFAESRFTTNARTIAQSFQDPTVVTFIDHGLLVANAYRALGPDTVNSYYTPRDLVHPNAKGAQVVEAAFERGLVRSQSPLRNYLKPQS